MIGFIMATLMLTQVPYRWEVEDEDLLLTSLRSPKISRELNLTEDQIRKINEIRYSYASKVVDLRAALQKKHLELNRVISKDGFTRAEIEPILKEIGTIEAELRLYRIMEIQEIKRVLTREQSEKLREILRREMRIRRKAKPEKD